MIVVVTKCIGSRSTSSGVINNFLKDVNVVVVVVVILVVIKVVVVVLEETVVVVVIESE